MLAVSWKSLNISKNTDYLQGWIIFIQYKEQPQNREKAECGSFTLVIAYFFNQMCGYVSIFVLPTCMYLDVHIGGP